MVVDLKLWWSRLCCAYCIRSSSGGAGGVVVNASDVETVVELDGGSCWISSADCLYKTQLSVVREYCA